MRKVELGMKEQAAYEIIKNLVQRNGNKKNAAIRLGITIRQVNRLIKSYIDKGKNGFIHGNKGRPPVNALNEETRDKILSLYSTKYFDASIEHAAELIEKHDNIKVSASALRTILIQKHILSPYVRKKTLKAEKLRLEAIKKQTGLTMKETETIDQFILNIDEAHPRRPRMANAGELIQMPVYFYNKTKAVVIKVFDHTLFASIHDKIYALEIIHTHNTSSKAFDPPAEKAIPRKVYTPPMSHPWRLFSFNNFFNITPDQISCEGSNTSQYNLVSAAK